jgi:hypothetical protein
MAYNQSQAQSAKLPSVASKQNFKIPIHARYENWINGEYTKPAKGQYFVNPTPITGQPLCEVARSTAEDVERALDSPTG